MKTRVNMLHKFFESLTLIKFFAKYVNDKNNGKNKLDYSGYLMKLYIEYLFEPQFGDNEDDKDDDEIEIIPENFFDTYVDYHIQLANKK